MMVKVTMPGKISFAGSNHTDRKKLTDNHGRLVTAIREQFHNAIRQRCQTHFSKNILDKTAKKSRAEIGPQLTDMYNSPSLQEACQRRYNLIGKLKKHLQGSSIA